MVRIGRECVRQDLQGDLTVELRVPGLPEPMPPSPILAVTEYGPRVVPGVSGMIS